MKTSKKSLEYLPLDNTETGPINILSFHIIYEPGIPGKTEERQMGKRGGRRKGRKRDTKI
ncbi:MAG: hypothetical protein AB3K77_07330 [Methanosarcinaceae archaeon]|uniref:hypothetical protein n=1 Tax=Methanosarcina sp. MTP4 TaxID=1434100 RepID=UPI000B13B37B|nr:hypothetical protein [Methanosarcina sp. MTP4]